MSVAIEDISLEVFDLSLSEIRIINEASILNLLPITGSVHWRSVRADRWKNNPACNSYRQNTLDTSQVVHKVVNEESCIYWEGYQYVVPESYLQKYILVFNHKTNKQIFTGI